VIAGILVGLTTVALLIASAHSDRQKRNAIAGLADTEAAAPIDRTDIGGTL
jgi:hypothetical protein